MIAELILGNYRKKENMLKRICEIYLSAAEIKEQEIALATARYTMLSQPVDKTQVLLADEIYYAAKVNTYADLHSQAQQMKIQTRMDQVKLFLASKAKIQEKLMTLEGIAYETIQVTQGLQKLEDQVRILPLKNK